jgi:hypothetical protein
MNDCSAWKGAVPVLPERITAALRMRVEDLRPLRDSWQVQLHEKPGAQHAMLCHHALAEALRAPLDAAGTAEGCKGWLCRTGPGTTARFPAPV